jgi:hypothetical protein
MVHNNADQLASLSSPTAGVPGVLAEVAPSGTVYYIREPSGALLAHN